MKKISLASGILAMGLLASCSNDAPEIKTNTPDNGDVKYISVKIDVADNATRGETGANTPDDEGTDAEKQISSATLYLVDESGNVVIARNTGVDADLLPTIPFALDAASFKALTAKQGTGKYKLYIIANPAANSYVMNNFEVDAIVEKTSWAGTAGKFLMSNDSEVEVILPSYDATDTSNNGSSDQTSWVINPAVEGETSVKVVLHRLAARFDLKTKDKYTYEVNEEATNNSAEFTVQGVVLRNVNTKSYIFRHMSNTGKFVAGSVFGENGHLVTPKASWYDQKLADMPTVANYAYTSATNYIGNFKLLTYGFENSLDGKIDSDTPEDTKAEMLSYRHVTYMGFKVKFTYPGFTTTGKEFFVYNGEIVGFLEDIKKENFVPSSMSAANQTAVATILADIRSTSPATDAAWKTELANKGLELFTPNNDGDYFCYYVHPIYNGFTTDSDGECCKYRVRRNRLYKINLGSIAKIGHNGDFKPDPIIPDEDGFVGLEIEIKPWTTVFNTFDFD